MRQFRKKATAGLLCVLTGFALSATAASALDTYTTWTRLTNDPAHYSA